MSFKASASEKGKRETADGEVSASEFDCSICFELLHEPVVGTCGHDFCKCCYDQWIGGKRAPPCPICKKPLPTDLGVCLRLRNTINKLFPAQAAERSLQVEEFKRHADSRPKKRREQPTPTRPEQSWRRVIYESSSHRPHRGLDTSRAAADSVSTLRRILNWVHLPESRTNNRDTALPAVSGPSQLPHFIFTPTRTAPPVFTQQHQQQQSQLQISVRSHGAGPSTILTRSLPMIASGSLQVMGQPSDLPLTPPVSATIMARESEMPHQFFVIGTRATPFYRSSRYSARRRLRHVPTRFSPEFTIPPTTLPPVSDVMDM